MTRNEFVKELSDYCEFEGENLSVGTKLKSIENFDSLAVLSMIAFIDENFDKKFTAQQLNDLSDFQSIIDLIGFDKFEDD